MKRSVHLSVIAIGLILSAGAGIAWFLAAPAPALPAVAVRLVKDEAEAVLSLLAKRTAGQTLGDQDWQGLLSTQGFVRLKQREAAIGRPFTDEDFKRFVLTEELLARAPALRETLTKWEQADVGAAASRAMAYLPRGARIRATIYPVIKPKENSFVFDVPADPAIFLYLDPDQSREKFENTLVHELHHIGYGSTCPPKAVAERNAHLPQNERSVLTWLGAFGEGFAMLAAAGGPDVHPHAVSNPKDRARWDRDVANFNSDQKKLEGFFLDVLEKRLEGEEAIQKVAFTFFGEQGPWYTVGWQMAVVIEKAYGRAKLIEVFCDERNLLPTYNRAAAQLNLKASRPLALWSSNLVNAVSGTGGK